MPEFHFDCGDSGNGPIGFCAVVDADTKEEALKLLKDQMPLEFTVPKEDFATEQVVYLTVYFNPDNITLQDGDLL